jgi:hypothetical protein
MFKTNEDLATYFAALSLPRDIVMPYSHMVDKWLVCNGTEWTVNRCKSIYTDFIRYRAGLPLEGKWYRKNRDGLPHGILSRIFKLSRRKSKQFSCSTLLRSYTRFISHDATDQQISKFMEGVTTPDIMIDPIMVSSMCDVMVSYVGVRAALISQPSFLSYQPSPGKRVPTCWGTTKPEESHWSTQWETIEETRTGLYLRAKYNNIFRDVFAGFTPMRIGVKSFSPQGIDSVGKIGLIQEPGYKLRAVANPNRVYQIALKPLGDIIYDTLKELPWDCTFDQSKALPMIQSHLRNGNFAHCVDLSGATDYFPLSLQISLLNRLYPNHLDYIKMFEDISRSPWIFQDTTIVWTKGQPLGLYPSFGSFALTHGALLLSLNGGKHENAFFILGDDVVILDDDLASAYRSALVQIGCPVSESKSISSCMIAEFGGKIISHDVIEPQLKWRQLSDDNFIDIIRLLGAKAMRLLRPQQRKVVKAIWDIPDFVGGLGFNPDGIPLADRYEKYLTIFGEDHGTFLMSYDRKFNFFFNEEGENPNSSRTLSLWDGSKLPDLDQRSAALCLKYLPNLHKFYGILGTNLYTVSLDKGVLPIDGLTGKRVSLLMQLQHKLRK